MRICAESSPTWLASIPPSGCAELLGSDVRFGQVALAEAERRHDPHPFTTVMQFLQFGIKGVLERIVLLAEDETTGRNDRLAVLHRIESRRDLDGDAPTRPHHPLQRDVGQRGA